MSKPTLTAHFISQSYEVEGNPEIAEHVCKSTGVVTFPSVAASGAATAAIIRMGSPR
jgi:hypothetical protein